MLRSGQTVRRADPRPERWPAVHRTPQVVLRTAGCNAAARCGPYHGAAGSRLTLVVLCGGGNFSRSMFYFVCWLLQFNIDRI